ncbi:MAG: oligosaccharide flippase family protein [Pseudomonadota bacterium]
MRKIVGLTGLTAAGQLTFVVAMPLLSRLFTPADFGLFTIYLSIVNIFGPIIGLKFDSGLYAANTREQARAMLGLAIATMSLVALVIASFFPLIGGHLSGTFGAAISKIGFLLPIGIFLAGMWSSTSAWAIKSGAISTLAIARFLQPALMTVLQLAAGLAHLPGLAMVIAHLVSHATYGAFILARSLNKDDWKHLFSLSAPLLLKHAREQIKFPLFTMPAQVSMLMGSNLPPILIGLIFGMDKAGYCGIAYRLVTAPISIISLPLGHVFTSEVSRDRSLSHLQKLGTRIFIASLFIVVVPMLIGGFVAPHVAGRLLGARWAATGEVIFAFSIFGGMQAITTPFTEITSIYRLQILRFFVEISSATFVFIPLGLSALNGWTFKSTIWIMSISGALGLAIGFAFVCAVLRHRLLNVDLARQIAVASATTSPLS